MLEDLASLDKLVHEPARLAILTALSTCRSADFLFLQRLTGLTKGNLSSHLAKLDEAKLVTIEKGFVGKVPRTTVSITQQGSAAVRHHWEQLDRLRAGATARQLTGKHETQDQSGMAHLREEP